MQPGTPFYTRHGHKVFPAPDAVIKSRTGIFALAIGGNGLVLFVEQRDANGAIDLPGGGIEAGETHDQALQREWAEETGLPFLLQGPHREYHHIRGFYAEDVNEFWIYDQTFRLYDYTGEAEAGKSWVNSEGDMAHWKPFADLGKLRIHNAHRLGIDALTKD